MFKNTEGERIKEEDPLLKSLLYCYHCHNKLQVINKKDNYKGKITKRRYVICSTAVRPVSNRICYKQYINYDKLENKILDKISNVFNEYLHSNAFDDEKLLDKLINTKSNKGKLEEKLMLVNNQLKTVNKKLTTLYNDKLNELIEDEDYSLFSEGLKNERNKLENLKIETENKISEFKKGFCNIEIKENVKKVISNIVEKQEFKKEDLQQLVNKIEIDKDKNIIIHFNFYELNCIGGHFTYDDRKAASS